MKLDIIEELRELAFASRLKRLSDRLMKDVSLIYQKLDVDFEARWFSILYTLNRKSPMTVTELAEVLKLTHTAINQLSSEMNREGLVFSRKDKQDERQRLLFISEKGKETAVKLRPVWEEIRLATKTLIEFTGCDVLAVIHSMEKQLDKQDMYHRVWMRISDELPHDLEICDYRPAYKKYFKSLNIEWLEEFFIIEETDKKILDDPNGRIIKKGGVVLFARLNDQIVGTCALIKHRNGILELAKMAVSKKYQNMGVGKALLKAAIERAKVLGAGELYLLTSEKLQAANHLYKKFGFKIINTSPISVATYNRRSIAMKLSVK